MLPGVSPRGRDPCRGILASSVGRALQPPHSPARVSQPGQEGKSLAGLEKRLGGQAMPCLHPACTRTPLVPRMGWVPPALPRLLAPQKAVTH